METLELTDVHGEKRRRGAQDRNRAGSFARQNPNAHQGGHPAFVFVVEHCSADDAAPEKGRVRRVDRNRRRGGERYGRVLGDDVAARRIAEIRREEEDRVIGEVSELPPKVRDGDAGANDDLEARLERLQARGDFRREGRFALRDAGEDDDPARPRLKPPRQVHGLGDAIVVEDSVAQDGRLRVWKYA